MDKNFKNDDGKNLKLDQFFKKEENFYFVEQKIRDDHDSTKKRGQMDNFEKKLNVILKKYGDISLKCFFYFIDPDLDKNKNYYCEKINKIKEVYNIPIFLCYGGDFFKNIEISNVWHEIIGYLKKWRAKLPETPEINFDIKAKDSFNEIKDIKPIFYRKILENDKLFSMKLF